MHDNHAVKSSQAQAFSLFETEQRTFVRQKKRAVRTLLMVGSAILLREKIDNICSAHGS